MASLHADDVSGLFVDFFFFFAGDLDPFRLQDDLELVPLALVCLHSVLDNLLVDEVGGVCLRARLRSDGCAHLFCEESELVEVIEARLDLLDLYLEVVFFLYEVFVFILHLLLWLLLTRPRYKKNWLLLDILLPKHPINHLIDSPFVCFPLLPLLGVFNRRLTVLSLLVLERVNNFAENSDRQGLQKVDTFLRHLVAIH